VLIKHVISGEKSFFEVIMRRYNQRLYRIGMSVLNDDAETEDAMQAAYINAYEHLASFKQLSSFATWLTRIMINECLGRRKSRRRSPVDTVQPPNHKTSLSTPMEDLMNKELNTMLEAAIAGLPEQYRTVFILREIEELSIRETGQVLDITEANVKVRLNRAKTMLRGELKGYIKDHVYAFHLTRCDRVVAAVMARITR
jgi:RNA polymerase sigma-70 factor (ECF subfamily)